MAAEKAPTPATGIVEGRVLNLATGDYMENVRVSVEKAGLETFTDSSGFYRLTRVPAGKTEIRAFHTGSPAQSRTVEAEAGRTVMQDFSLTSGGIQKLDNFQVKASREMDGAAIAINTQRFAPNTMDVVAADEFGLVTSGGAGEILKSLPGIAAESGGRGDPFAISLNGVPNNYVPVSVGGFSLAFSTTGANRSVSFHQVTTDAFSRIEVSHTPTPETPGSGLGGSINMVPRSAFERVRPVYSLGTTLIMRDNERSLRRTPGPNRHPTHKITQSFEFTAVVPVNRTFGFSVSASTFPGYTPTDFSQNVWRGVTAATNGGTLPDTVPGQPYLTDYTFRDGTSWARRSNIAATADLKLGRYDRLSFSFQWGDFYDDVNRRDLRFFVNRVLPGNFSTTSVRGFTGAGEVRHVYNAYRWDDTLLMPTLTYRHDGPVWKMEVGVGYSRATRQRLDSRYGNFFDLQARRQNVTVAFDDINYLRPGRITVTDGTTGAPLDPYRIGNYFLSSANNSPIETVNVRRSLFANVRRDFGGRLPLTLKAGIDVGHEDRDIRQKSLTYSIVGADGRATAAADMATSDDGAARFFDGSFSQRIPPYGFPRTDWLSNGAVFDHFRAQPGHFSVNEINSYTQEVGFSKHAEELISAAYVRGDLALLGGRLKLVGGVRAEQTNVRGEGQLIDATRNFRRDASGRVVTVASPTPADPNRRVPDLINPAGSLAAARLTNVDRGLRAEKEYLRLLPSLNASYNLRENLIARVGYYWSLGRPNFNQYAGSLTLPNTEEPPGPSNRISVNNAGIKVWTARSTNVRLEYYFENGGLFAVNAFRRDFENFFGGSVVRPTPEFLSLYGLDPNVYGDYDVSTQVNLPYTVRMTGVSVSYKQALAFMPNWARWQVFANGTAQRALGDESNAFAGYTPRTANWGVSLNRGKAVVRAKWNYRGLQRRAPVAAGRSIEPGTFNWNSKRLLIDVSGEYLLHKHATLFFELNNVGDTPVDFQAWGPSTPQLAQFNNRSNYGALWTFGVKATY